MNSIMLAWLHLWRRPLSSLIALAGLTLSVGISGILLRLYLLSGQRFETIARAGDAIVGAKSGGLDILLGLNNQEGEYPEFIPLNLFLSIKNKSPVKFEDGVTIGQSPVEAAIPFIYFAKFGESKIIGTEAEFVTLNRMDLPRVDSGRWAENIDEVVLGHQLSLKYKVGDEITAEPWTGKYLNSAKRIRLKVVGILSETHRSWDLSIFSNLNTAQAVLRDSQVYQKSIWHENVLHYFMIFLYPRADARHWMDSLVNERTVTQLIWVQDEFIKLKRLTSAGRDIGFLISVFIILLGAFSVTAVLLTRFEGMMAQMAVLRALGYTKFKLTQVILAEALVLGISSCFLGSLIDVILFPSIRFALGTSLPATIEIPIWQVAPIWGVTLLANIFSVIIPLWRVYRQNLHNSLRLSL